MPNFLYTILKSRSTQLLDVINFPDKLANDLAAVDLISGPTKRKVLTTNCDEYHKASILVNEVCNSLNVFNDSEILVKFCDVLKTQDDPNLRRIVDVMLKELARAEKPPNIDEYIPAYTRQDTNTKFKTILCGAVVVGIIAAIIVGSVYRWTEYLYKESQVTQATGGAEVIECYVEFEAEYGTFTGTRMHRSEASKKLTVLVTFAERIEHYFTTTSNCEASLKGLYYSNDGDTDNVTLSIDGLIIGHIETVKQNGAGHLWNVIRNSGPIGNNIHIDSGKHSLLLFVISTDVNGVEIDKTSWTFSCERADDSVNGKCPQTLLQVNDVIPDQESSYISFSMKQIAALQLGAISLCIGYVMFKCLANYRYR